MRPAAGVETELVVQAATAAAHDIVSEGGGARGEGEGGQAAAKEAAGAARECAERARAVMGADFVEQTGAMLTALIEDADALCPDHGGDDMES